jgi:hypothetical protein
VSVVVCVEVFAGAPPWIWLDSGLVWLDDVLLATTGRGWSVCR